MGLDTPHSRMRRWSTPELSPMAELDRPDHDHDLDGHRLMASLRARLASTCVAATHGTGNPTAAAEQYRPAMAAIQALLTRRAALGASGYEQQKLQSVANTLLGLSKEFG